MHGSFVEAQDEEDDATAFAAHARALYIAAYGGWMAEVFDRDTGSGSLTGWVEPRVLFAKG